MLDMNEPQWYVLQTQYGYEQIAEENLNQMVKSSNLNDFIFSVVVPREEDVVERNGKKKLVLKNKFPNYIFIKMIYTKQVWYMVKNTRGVKDFCCGYDGKPLPMSQEEVKKAQLEEVKIEDLNLAVGDIVNIISGPFKDWSGEVVEIKPEEQKVRVDIQIYGRATAMDLEFTQVEKIGK